MTKVDNDIESILLKKDCCWTSLVRGIRDYIKQDRRTTLERFADIFNDNHAYDYDMWEGENVPNSPYISTMEVGYILDKINKETLYEKPNTQDSL